MKTIVCQEPNKMDIVTQEDNLNVAANEVLIAIKRIGVCGTDTHAYGGNQPFFEYPRVLGHELSGLVEATGQNVNSIKIGDTLTVIPYVSCGECIACRNGKSNCCSNMEVIGVHRDGGMAEYLKVPADNVFVVNDLSMEEAAIVEPLSIGAHAIRRADIKEGETVLVVGAGPIGLGVARFAKLAGAKTVIMDLSEERLNTCKKWAECDFAVKAGESAYQEILDLNNGELPSTVLDATGNKHSMMKSFEYVSHGGKLVYVGLVKDTISFFDPDFHSKECTLLASRNATKEDFKYVIDCMSKGLINDSYVTKKINFNEVPSFFEAGDFQSNKTMITLNS
ncbi:zinc-binding alcohol dehydrogenase family protein [Virgibacillus natechei]|uniref:zinc-binding alcohol dehydrogenase family protein n=1 Tax=Virgibacillus sp. CBA3643 TaxID=2942278 RepID=UPI0035A312AA